VSDHRNIVRICGASSLPTGTARTFPLPDSDEQGFLIGTPDGLRAFRNRCRHWPVPLDMDDADFWSPELGAIVCKVHGAVFRGHDGACLAGPCAGAALQSWPVAIEGEDALVDLS